MSSAKVFVTRWPSVEGEGLATLLLSGLRHQLQFKTRWPKGLPQSLAILLGTPVGLGGRWMSHTMTMEPRIVKKRHAVAQIRGALTPQNARV